MQCFCSMYAKDNILVALRSHIVLQLPGPWLCWGHTHTPESGDAKHLFSQSWLHSALVSVMSIEVIGQRLVQCMYTAYAHIDVCLLHTCQSGSQKGHRHVCVHNLSILEVLFMHYMIAPCFQECNWYGVRVCTICIHTASGQFGSPW